MKILLAIGLVFGSIGSFVGVAPNAQERQDARVDQKVRGMELLLVSQKRRYKRNDQFRLEVMLKNSSERDFYVFGTLDWGYSASLMFYIHDASGKEIQPQLSPDSRTYASPDDKNAFVRLGPDHFLGTTYFAPLKFMNLTRPGRYAIFVEYTSPFSTAEVELKPFFGKENGTIKSNVVYVEVLR